MSLKPLLGVLALTLAGAGSLSAATLTFQFTEDGSDVYLTAYGAVSDATQWTILGESPVTPESVVDPNKGYVAIYTQDWALFTGSFPSTPSGFGPGIFNEFVGNTVATQTNSALGSMVGIDIAFGGLYLPQGYLWGDPLSSEAIFSGHSFATLGLTEGTYSWVVGNDTFEVKVGSGGGSAVPETGTTLVGLALAMAGLVTLRQRAARRSGTQD